MRKILQYCVQDMTTLLSHIDSKKWAKCLSADSLTICRSTHWPRLPQWPESSSDPFAATPYQHMPLKLFHGNPQAGWRNVILKRGSRNCNQYQLSSMRISSSDADGMGHLLSLLAIWNQTARFHHVTEPPAYRGPRFTCSPYWVTTKLSNTWLQRTRD